MSEYAPCSHEWRMYPTWAHLAFLQSLPSSKAAQQEKHWNLKELSLAFLIVSDVTFGPTTRKCTVAPLVSSRALLVVPTPQSLKDTPAPHACTDTSPTSALRNPSPALLSNPALRRLADPVDVSGSLCNRRTTSCGAYSGPSLHSLPFSLVGGRAMSIRHVRPQREMMRAAGKVGANGWMGSNQKQICLGRAGHPPAPADDIDPVLPVDP